MATTGISLTLWFSLDPFASVLTTFCLGNEEDEFPAAEETEAGAGAGACVISELAMVSPETELLNPVLRAHDLSTRGLWSWSAGKGSIRGGHGPGLLAVEEVSPVFDS